MAERRNSEGYYDPTAYAAMRNVEKTERRERAMTLNRGDIYYIESGYTVGSEQRPGRPAIIVSNDKNNHNSSTVEVVYLTTRPKEDLPTHVTIRSIDRESIAICEQITTVAIERIGNYKGRATDAEMTNIAIAMMVSLDLQMGKTAEAPAEVVKPAPPAANRPDFEVAYRSEKAEKERLAAKLEKQSIKFGAELSAAESKCEMLQQMYEALLSRVITKSAREEEAR